CVEELHGRSHTLLSPPVDEYKSKVVCEEERLRLSCKTGMQIAVYSAMFGRTQQGTLECPPHHRRAPSVDCQSEVALQVMTSRCQGRRTCVIRASVLEFGDPCYSGTRKYLSVIYTCGELSSTSLSLCFSLTMHMFVCGPYTAILPTYLCTGF
uniref:SUEL-type lectin domain-containing protein n=1 Tax=Astyanax mexicanus TaxID=7994 RepID=A0A3B1JQ44_ASTMX